MARRSQRTATNHKILVVDDQEEVLQSLDALLRREGHTVYTALSGASALELFKEKDVHLLLVDYFMPHMNGEELIREVRKFDPYVQIILQTGYSGEKPARQMMAELEIQGYHDKADGPDKLLLWIDTALKARQLIRGLRESEQLQRELIANVSHEFRTPLNIIFGYADLLLEGDLGELPAEARKAISRLARATHDLSELVSDLLSYARIEAGGDEDLIEVVNTANLTGELERLAGLLSEGKPVAFEVDTSKAPEQFDFDLGKLRVVLRNLVSNAAKFTGEGKVKLSIEREADGEMIFSVLDSGPGIAREDQLVIFEPFRQLNGSMTRRHRGVGLGLALARKVARLLDGDIHVESEPGAGAKFTLRVPLRALPGTSAKPRLEAMPPRPVPPTAVRAGGSREGTVHAA
jgi:signal transduction histidine kinase